MPKSAMTAAKAFPVAIEKVIRPAPFPIVHDRHLFEGDRHKSDGKHHRLKSNAGAGLNAFRSGRRRLVRAAEKTGPCCLTMPSIVVILYPVKSKPFERMGRKAAGLNHTFLTEVVTR
jgi:hypothetical protein